MRLFFMLSALCPLLVACSGASTPQKTTGLTPLHVSPEEPEDALAEDATPSTGGEPTPTDLRQVWTLEVVAQSPPFASVHHVVRKGDAVILNGVALSAAEGRALEQHLDAIDWEGQPDTPPAAIGGATYTVRVAASGKTLHTKSVAPATLGPLTDTLKDRGVVLMDLPDCASPQPAAPRCLPDTSETCATAYAPVVYYTHVCTGAG